MEDLLSDPSDDNVSDVDPEELQKMLEVKKNTLNSAQGQKSTFYPEILTRIWCLKNVNFVKNKILKM